MKKTSLTKIFLLVILAACLFSQPISLKAQDTSKCKHNCDLSLGSDIVSRYVWRGQDLYNTPSIQPVLTFSCGNFSIGSWGSFSMVNADIQETHLFTSYTYKFITVGVFDYFFMDYARDTATGFIKNNNYFDYGNNTSHVFEGDLTITGPEKLPLKLTAAYNFYGNDAAKSTYFELGYTGSVKETPYDAFIGFTPKAGWYGTTAGVVNIGVTGYKSISISSNYDLLFKSSLVVNPQAENIYLVFGITL